MGGNEVSDRKQFDELCFYTLGHKSPAFIHQNAADAFTAQHAEEGTKPIAVVFALLGLYLHLEKGFTGRQVQLAHMELGRRRREWPRLPLPATTGRMGVGDVLAGEPGPERDARIGRWCASVWAAWGEVHPAIAELARRLLDVR